jgi:hypothetical protein
MTTHQQAKRVKDLSSRDSRRTPGRMNKILIPLLACA